MSKTATVFFSNGGNSKFVGKVISKANSSKLLEIKEINKNRKGIMLVIAAIESLIGHKSSINSIDISSFGTIFLGFPVWAGNTPPAINSFIDKSNLNNKKIVLFVQSGSGRSDGVINKLTDKILAKGGEVIGSYSAKFGGRKINPLDIKEGINTWIKSLD